MSQTQLASHSRGGFASGRSHSHTSVLFVRAMICLTAVLTLGMVSLVFYRAQSIIEPTAAVLVIGDRSLSGARVAVLSDHHELIAATLSDQNDFTTPILLQPGLYELQVDVHGKPLLADRFRVQRFKYATFSLPTGIMVKGDASMAGARVEITGERETPISIDLNVDNDYTAISYHLPGTYHVTVTREGHLLKDQVLILVAHTPRRISLIARSDSAGFSD